VVRLLSVACQDGHGQYVHWGATTQDILDTGLVLQLIQASALLRTELTRVRDAAAELARTHRSDVMPGRTHGQHAVPVTFGYKMALYVDEFDRHIANFDRVAAAVRVVQFGGAAGTLASVGRAGLAVRRELASELGLAEPAITWHIVRDRILDFAYHLTSVGLSLQRFSRMVITLQGNETGELAEPFHMGKVGSSTMPQKRNPVLCETMWSLCVLVEDAFRSLMRGSIHEHERDMAAWQLEWEALPRLCVNIHHALSIAGEVLEGLRVDPVRMRANVDMTNGLIMSEALMMRLAPHIGRQDAHDVVYDAAMEAFESGAGLIDLLRADERVDGLDAAQELTSPTSVIDAAEDLVDHVLGAADR
jgi:3-carboxy-cis,cis-muconate cycloisomerase